MGMREIPAAYEFTCDSCKTTASQNSNSRPAYWCELVIAQEAYDYQGCAVADGTIRRLLCNDCRLAVIEGVNASIEQRRAFLAKENARHG